MPRDDTADLRARIDAATYADEETTVSALTEDAALPPEARATISARGAALVKEIRAASRPGLMEVFLAEYGLSTDEGIALMCLAEALLRVPDAETIDALIEDKIAPSDWGKHLGKSASSLVNASTWALMLTGRVLDDDRQAPFRALRGAVKRLGEPVIRTAVGRAMREMGRQFVLGEDIDRAMSRAAKMEAKGYTYSYDMLGEAARTEADALRYLDDYATAITAISRSATADDVTKNPGISVKLSALHPRYEEAQHDRALAEIVPRLVRLCQLAKDAKMGLNIDAEESDRLAISLDVIEAALTDPSLDGWNGFGIVVQAYGQRAGHVIDWVHDLAGRTGQRIMVRLVKGAYWDAEIKRAQVMGLKGFPVFTSKVATDISYAANARKLLGMTDRLYPQFATHNAHTMATILEMAKDMPRESWEFQRLHGMGETLHNLVLGQEKTRHRIYAPVGAHEDLLAYLVRRLLENGANSSFVNQIVDESVPPEVVAADPFAAKRSPAPIAEGPEMFAPERANSKGWDQTHRPTLAAIDAARGAFRKHEWHNTALNGESHEVRNPADPADLVGTVTYATEADAKAAHAAATPWSTGDRAAILNAAADAYEAHAEELFAILHREAGKSLPDAIGEVREAVDFLRYYAAGSRDEGNTGTWVCISPWNFPLAIFTGQIAAALSMGNAVIAKPAEQTPLIASRAVELLHAAGVPTAALQLLPGDGSTGAALVTEPSLAGVAFTGSTETARRIRASMADHCAPGTPLIAETGGLNAMIVDSTALPEHAVRDILASSFQSAGQRCSALRCLYVQEDIAPKLLTMLKGAMDTLQLGDPWELSTDVGPVIDEEARASIADYVATARTEGRVLHELTTPDAGTFVAPTLIEVSDIDDLTHEVFGPVLHVATFKATEVDHVIERINAQGYGLTFGLHTRIDDRVQEVMDDIHVGNAYVNRNQIGAIVGSQPFGGEGLSGTGPKAGGPNYLTRFAPKGAERTGTAWTGQDSSDRIAKAFGKMAEAELDTLDLPGPTGESNRLTFVRRSGILCLGPSKEVAEAQATEVRALGGEPVIATGSLAPDDLATLPGLSAVLWWGDADEARVMEQALARRDGPLVPLVTFRPDKGHVCHERHVCIDTTAAGGNAQLLAAVAG
ncbi:bifunctional proline dehydrogenase/L-glutamate gamma-semialdehyde dehydrogenase PutA [Pelagovum pacificum]|uniref:Bifunctional protein PutA n=1 Tax=Pelagovum pacificum TaxID=2588711 RepID=A0A5C5GES6_9RHOB|nr:bifunctional proline dehydrogenase/L-glutamate gamma-semialdehyde dehydrogenase PutA [Pelagovum pacificum]QQA43620.1 bifunctional proline dehydrogenase/L-glutamate gamma-semialdehyde dehydrogenase PutA [Pelagovum pacificum]TNY33245.1 bifunctional proline dehydrogenase/L-glutamate gamma-semialdehyde dehydrogenase PutA [Pelagovum pacificum]